MQPYDFTWIFVLTLLFALFDAYGIGANDVANSFATSVGSRSLTLFQAVMIALVTEAAGAILLGASTTDTIRSNIIRVDLFKDRPELLMEGFMCALISSSTWLMYATYMGWPVSCTHSIVGALTGVGISAFGFGAIDWTFNGMGKIIVSWFTSPIVAGVVAAAVFLSTKTIIFRSKNPLRAGIYLAPWYFAFTLSIMFFYVGLKNGKWKPVDVELNWVRGWSLKSTRWNEILIPTASIFCGVLLIGYTMITPYFIRLLENEEDLRWYHAAYIWFVPTQPKNENLARSLAQTFTPDDLAKSAGQASSVTIVAVGGNHEQSHEHMPLGCNHCATTHKTDTKTAAAVETSHMDRPFDIQGAMDRTRAKIQMLLHNSLFADVASAQSANAQATHNAAIRYDNKVEYLFSMLQVFTAAFAAFAHGSNDIANATGPLTGVYDIWVTGKTPGSKVDVQVWILVISAIALDFGLALYGYNIMRTLGNNLTFHSPMRGFAIEFGTALTVVTGSFMGVPLATTHCVTGATVAIGLCNGTLKAVNWRMMSWCLFSWLFTVPFVSGFAGLLYALLTRGGSFSY